MLDVVGCKSCCWDKQHTIELLVTALPKSVVLLACVVNGMDR